MKNIKFVAGGLVFLFMIIGVLGMVSAGNMVIRSVPAETNWIADGVTEYRMDVYLDGTQVSTGIQGSEWEIFVPSYFNVTNADWPSYPVNPSTDSNDFFYNFLMYSPANKVSSTVVGGKLRTADNVRMTNNFDGPVNNNAIIARYWFTVNTDAPVGEINFTFGDETLVLDTDWTYYGKGYSGILEQINTPFTIVPEPFSCFGIPFDNAAVCGGVGSCVAQDTCSCPEGWSGDECTIPDAVADAGEDFFKYEGNMVYLDGSGSENADTYLWEQINGTSVTLVNTTGVLSNFYAPLNILTIAEATLRFRLTVNPGQANEAVDEVEVYARLPGDANGDNGVNAFDVARFRRLSSEADFNADGRVNAFDLAKLRQNSGRRRF